MANEKLIPDGVRDERAERLLQLLERWDELPIEQVLVYRVDQAELDLLRQLAWQLHVMGVEGWDITDTRAQRRELVRRAMLLHARKGTPWAIKAALKDAGYGGATIEERLPLLRHDASANYTGVRTHGGGSHWARFRVRLDLGEQRGITSETTGLAIRLIEAWKNARSHLEDLTYEAHVAEEIDTAEDVDTAVVKHTSELLPWGLRHDGAITRDQGERVRHDGVWQHDGALTFTSWRAAGHQYDNHWDKTDVAVRPALSDQPSVRADYGGHLHHSGFSRGSAPAVLDPAMPIQITRHQWHDGRHRHAGDLHDGEQAHDGARLYWMGLRYTGHQTTRAVI